MWAIAVSLLPSDIRNDYKNESLSAYIKLDSVRYDHELTMLPMKNSFLVGLCMLVFFPLAYSQQSKVYDNLSMESKILNMPRKYAVYLPPGYDVSERSYPVLYLLHGGGDDQTGWIQFGEVQHIADKSIKLW